MGRLARILKLHQLRAVAAIAAEGSLLRAAAKLGVSQPALSKTLGEVERELGIPLFDRHARGVVATAAGRAVEQTAGRILLELAGLERELADLTGTTDTPLAVGALPVAAAGLLPGTLAFYRQSQPALPLRLAQGATEILLPDLLAGAIDLVIGRLYAPETPDGLLREPLYAEPMSILARAGHPVLQRESVTIDTIRSLALVLPTVSQRVGGEIQQILGACGLDGAAALRASSPAFLREILLSTDDVTVAPRLMMAGDLLRGTLRVVPLELPGKIRLGGIIRRPGAPLTRAALALVEALRAQISVLADAGIVDITDGDSCR